MVGQGRLRAAEESDRIRAMTIKKPMKTAAPASDVADIPEIPAAGGATIADRFKLDAPDPSAKKGGPAGAGTKIAVIAGLIALGVAGFLAFMLYQHLEFLKAA